jgi:hypothetical protein
MASWNDIHLADVAAAQDHPDWTLQKWLLLVDNGVPLVVTAIVDGLVISGRLVNPVTWTQHLDEVTEGILLGMEQAFRDNAEGGKIPDNVVELFDDVRSHRFEDEARRGVESRQELEKEYREAVGDGSEVSLTDLPDELARRWTSYARSRKTVTFKDATVNVPPAQPIVVPMMRVQLSRISAWWPAPIAPEDEQDASPTAATPS